MATIDLQNRAPTVTRTPDFREIVERRYDVLNWAPKTPAQILAECWKPLGTVDEEYDYCYLTEQRIEGQVGDSKNPCKDPPVLVRVFTQLNGENETQVGDPSITYDQDNILEVSIEYWQINTATQTYQVPGTTAAPAPFASAILKEEIRTDDGTLIKIRRNYIANGTLSDVSEIRFGGKMIVRTITAIGDIPATPSGYTLVGPGVLHPDGRQVYTYQFAAAAGGGTPGTSGEISEDTTYSQSNDEGTTGVTVKTIRYVSPLSVVISPIPTPAGFVLIETGFEDDTGIRMWTGRFARGRGTVVTEVTINQTGVLVTYRKVGLDSTPSAPSPTIGGSVVQISTETRKADGYDITEVRWAEGHGLALDETTIQQKDALVIYHRVSLGVVPTTPTQTIGGTVTLFETSQRQEAGYTVYDYRWAEGDGQSSITSEGQPDGSRIYTVTTFTAAASIPAYPGGGTGYNTRLTQQPQNGYFQNTAVWHRPPDDDTYPKTIEFEEPGIAEFSGTPPQFKMRPPKQRTLLADVEITYGTSKISTAPFDIEAYATFYETYTPTDTGIAVQNQKGLGGYLAQASSESGTNDIYNGVLCDSFEAVLLSSIPSTFPSGLVTLKVDNDPYLTDINGVKIYRRTIISYTF